MPVFDSGAPVPGAGKLSPHVAWTPDPGVYVDDPRVASEAALIGLLCDVVEVEGPVVARRAYRLVCHARGLRAHDRDAWPRLDRACRAACAAGDLLCENPRDLVAPSCWILRSPGVEPVLLREAGRRAPDEMPLDELAVLLAKLGAPVPEGNVLALQQRAAGLLGWPELTAPAGAVLAQAYALLKSADMRCASRDG